jgi:hypothetical protein
MMMKKKMMMESSHNSNSNISNNSNNRGSLACRCLNVRIHYSKLLHARSSSSQSQSQSQPTTTVSTSTETAQQSAVNIASATTSAITYEPSARQELNDPHPPPAAGLLGFEYGDDAFSELHPVELNLGGVSVQHEFLVRRFHSQSVTDSGLDWTFVACLNCDTPAYVYPSSPPAPQPNAVSPPRLSASVPVNNKIWISRNLIVGIEFTFNVYPVNQS